MTADFPRPPRPEAWLRGPLAGVPALLQPAAHALVQVAEDVEQCVTGLDAHQVWDTTHGAASVGFHCRHLAGATDRLLTYARGDALSAEQLSALAGETAEPSAGESARELVTKVCAAIDRALAQIRATPVDRLLEPRHVGRGRLPSTVLGLLVHAADHASRHAGQIVTTAKIVRRPPVLVRPGGDDRYIGSLEADSPERERLELLQDLWDPSTRRHLLAAGLRAGWRCLEVGGGAGSVARWLAAMVRPNGHVVVTDEDPRFLDEVAQDGIEVRRHDILRDPLELATYDLVHCRAVLMHVADPDAAIATMVAALKPGGWLVIEDPDYSTAGAVTAAHPSAAWFDDTWQLIRRALVDRRIADPGFGRTAPARLRRAGLTSVGHEGTCHVTHAGEPAARLAKGHHRLMTLAGLLTDAQRERLDRLCDDPSFSFVDATMYAAWGQGLAGPTS